MRPRPRLQSLSSLVLAYDGDMDFDAAQAFCEKARLPAFRLRQLRRAVTHEYAADYDAIQVLPKKVREQLAEKIPFDSVEVVQRESSSDGSVKLRLQTHDGYPLEAVLMRFESNGGENERHTVCLSSQSGCALACTFCATGSMGLGRNLTKWEIFDQFLILSRIQKQRGGKIDNIVMMGMGEPFHNYDAVMDACRLMNDPEGPGVAARRIAISTAGWIPGIDKIAKEPLQVKLALSLHAPTNELRSELMPVTKKFPVGELMAACKRYRATTRRRIFVEYLMLDGVNDSDETAVHLAKLLGSDGFHVNLIRYNPTGSPYEASAYERVVQFSRILDKFDIPNSYRVSRGRDISAACGQLAAPVAAIKKANRAKRLRERELTSV